MASSVLGANVIVAAGSVDGMAGTAAYIRRAGNVNATLVFTQAFQVDKIDVSQWPPQSQVGFIDLGVNNEGRTPNPELTINFVKKIYASGHKILFIADEHGKKAWQDVLTQCGHDTSELVIRPKDRTKYGSSCAILSKKLEGPLDPHTQALLDAGHEADLHMNFDTPFGRIFNLAIKAAIANLERRVYLARHMAQHDTPDATIQGWMDEYPAMEANLPKILESGRDLGDGIFLYDGTIGPHDATAVFRGAYQKSSVAVLSGTTVSVAGVEQVGASIATNRNDLDILTTVQQTGIVAGGMTLKANFALKDLERAIEAVREKVTNRS